MTELGGQEGWQWSGTDLGVQRMSRGDKCLNISSDATNRNGGQEKKSYGHLTRRVNTALTYKSRSPRLSRSPEFCSSIEKLWGAPIGLPSGLSGNNVCHSQAQQSTNSQRPPLVPRSSITHSKEQNGIRFDYLPTNFP